MPILQLILTLVFIGLGVWLVNAKVPMREPFKIIFNVAVGVATAVWLLKLFGLWSPIMHLMLVLVIVGFAMYLITTYVPMPETLKLVLNVVVAVVVCVWALQVFGVLDGIGSLRIGR